MNYKLPITKVMRLVSLVAISAASSIAITSHANAAGESPFDGLDSGVVDIANVVASGNVQGIISSLGDSGQPNPIVRTAFPGDGENVSLDAARVDIRSLVVSDSTKMDSFGSGKFQLVAIWLPSIQPGHVLLVATGIRGDGARVSTAFSVAQVNGKQAIVGYGRIADLSATLRQFAGQGELRRVPSAAPGPPATGSGASRTETELGPVSALAVVGLLWGASAVAISLRRWFVK